VPEQVTTTDNASPIEAMRQRMLAEEEAAKAPPVITSQDGPYQNAAFAPVVVCSIWPETLTSQPFAHAGAGRKTYSIPAGSPENPSVKIFESTFQIANQLDSSGGEERLSPSRRDVPAMAYVENMIQYWTGDIEAPEGAHKGIGIIKGMRDSKGQIVPTSEELRLLRRAQMAYLQYLVSYADNLWDSQDPKKRNQIRRSPLYRLAAQLLGVDEKQHLWVRSQIASYNNCPRCGTRVLDFVEVCSSCNTDFVLHFMERNLTPDPRKWPGVASEIERRLEAATKPQGEKTK